MNGSKHWTRPFVGPVCIGIAALAGIGFMNTLRQDANVKRRTAHQLINDGEKLRATATITQETAGLKIVQWERTLGRNDPFDIDVMKTQRDIDSYVDQLPPSVTQAARIDLKQKSQDFGSDNPKRSNGAALTLIDTYADELNQRQVVNVEHRHVVELIGGMQDVALDHEMLTTTKYGLGIDPGPTLPDSDLRAYAESIITSAPATVEVGTYNFDEYFGKAMPDNVSGESRHDVEQISAAFDVTGFRDSLRWFAESRNESTVVPASSDLAASAHRLISRLDSAVSRSIERETARQRLTIDRSSEEANRLQLLMLALAIATLLCMLTIATRARQWITNLRRMANADSLTGLLTRQGLRERTDLWLQPKDRTPQIAIGVLVLDLDHFKTVNDKLGHSAGDLLLTAVSERITSQVVPATTAIARWGGDEFVVVAALTGSASATDFLSLGRRIVENISTPMDIDGQLITIGTSAGAAICECGACDFDDLFRAADRSLYDVKRAGRGDVQLSRCEVEPANDPALQAL
jgi:diguanylate cyclase (GGDEF)-like protein